MSFHAGQTAVIVAVPEAEPAVGRWRQRYDSSAPLGVPPHLTILYPFLEAALIDDVVLARLRRLFTGRPEFTVELRRFGRFPGVLYLAPEPAEPFRKLTAGIARQWPQAPPYGGEFNEIVPHLTVAHGVDDDTCGRIERDVAGRLPVRATVREGRLLAFDGDRWTTLARLACGRSSGVT